MKLNVIHTRTICSIGLAILCKFSSAQTDTTKAPLTDSLIKKTDTLKPKSDSLKAKSDTLFIFKQRGLVGKLARNLMVDTGDNGESRRLARNDRIFQRYGGRVIRNITIERRDFGSPIIKTDSSKAVKNKLTNLANNLHRKSREWVIRNNLFFREGQRMYPFLMADNERHLRDQDYLGDARILIKAVSGTRDSIDVTVITKDVLSIGGKFSFSNVSRAEGTLREDNFLGFGDRVEGNLFYDQKRFEKFGYGFQYTSRNIGGSFIDGTFGYRNFYPALKSNDREETRIYARLLKPLVHQLMRWTYALEGAVHKTANLYQPDSLYKADYRYAYYNTDAWGALNLNVKRVTKSNPDNRLRTLLGLRILNQQFQEIPTIHIENYNYRYANLFAILGSVSIFRQDFYKTQYIYGFGRNEDVPEGVDVTVTGGYTNKEKRVRPYLGMDLQLNYFSDRNDYFNYIFRLGGFGYEKKVEDVNSLFSVDFFGHLRTLGRWKQRTFLSASITNQSHQVLNEPLILDSEYGLPEINDGLTEGTFRGTVKAESVFYSNWSLFSFRFAGFVFANASWLRPEEQPWSYTKFYQSIGGGLRTRNESLTFGTLELKGYYFPKKNYDNEHFRIEFNTNIRFRYNRQLIKRPEFFRIN
ncbi:MAG TPA: hypothetical protein VM012_09830 [Flavitalea sp.]|nr:hypothetical protein [Flavitalea sp.]